MNPNPATFYSVELAESEGWFISQAAGNADGTFWRLERDDEAAIFDGDPAAHAHVVDAALNGNANAMRAMIFLAVHEPKECAIVETHAEAAGVWDRDQESPWSYEWGTLAQEKLAAIRARYNGAWDHPALVCFDGLHVDTESDVLHILDTCPDSLKAYCKREGEDLAELSFLSGYACGMEHDTDEGFDGGALEAWKDQKPAILL